MTLNQIFLLLLPVEKPQNLMMVAVTFLGSEWKKFSWKAY